jgi:hypothetical protein
MNKKIPSFVSCFLFFLFAFLFCFIQVAVSQKPTNKQDDMLNYQRVVTERAHKIVETLGISDSSQFKNVRDVIAQQYKDLRQVHDPRDKQIELAKNKPGADKKLVDEAVKKIEAGAVEKQDKLHKKFLSRLSKILTPGQVDLVKDGMTYSAMPITYRNYLAMLPNLTEEQKTRIYSWLAEAREHAMDGGSSKEKLGWFGKYKGKITNYLYAAGYDLKKEEANWLKRVKEEKDARSNSTNSQNTDIKKRASQIVDSLGIKDETKRSAILAILIQHFESLQIIFHDRKKDMQHAEAYATGNKELADARSEAAWNAANGKLNKVQATLLGKLSVVLTTEQNELIKDLMTEGGLHREYDHFLNLFPDLTELQKTQVLTYLKEAREHAMGAETAENRTQWFIKYRGRANNFLAAAGYNLKKATEELEARQANQSK